MCTAISYLADSHYFGRNLDLEISYGEKVVLAPRNYPFSYRRMPEQSHHFAMIGMATVLDRYPLYYDATNEYGLSMAALNFPGNAVYYPEAKDKDNVTPFEFIPWILSQYKTVTQAAEGLTRLNLVDIPFSPQLPLTPLHWILADREHSLVAEQTAQGLRLFENPVGVLTNNPTFDYHMQNLCNYRHLSTKESDNRFSAGIQLDAYSRGMGALGLPGDMSSASRFVRAAFTKLNSAAPDTPTGPLSQFFHILSSVAMVRGCLMLGDKYDKTIYSSCCDTEKGIYYYTTYGNRQITGIDMHSENLDSCCLIPYSLVRDEQIRMESPSGS